MSEWTNVVVGQTSECTNMGVASDKVASDKVALDKVASGQSSFRTK